MSPPIETGFFAQRPYQGRKALSKISKKGWRPPRFQTHGSGSLSSRIPKQPVLVLQRPELLPSKSVNVAEPTHFSLQSGFSIGRSWTPYCASGNLSQDRRGPVVRLGALPFREKNMRKFVATCLASALLLTAGCEARTQVAKEKALDQIDSLLGSMDVKRKEIELSVGALKDSLAGLRKAKITVQVKLDQIDRKARPVEERLATIDDTLKTLRDHLKSATAVEIAGRTYSQDELKADGETGDHRAKGVAEQLTVLWDSQARLKKVVATLEQRQQEYEQKLSAIENRVAVIDASRSAL